MRLHKLIMRMSSDNGCLAKLSQVFSVNCHVGREVLRDNHAERFISSQLNDLMFLWAMFLIDSLH